MAEIRVNSTGGVKLYDADDSHYAQIKAGTVTSNTDVLELGSGAVVAGTKVDLNGQELILDADADTSITADTDDQIDVRIAGADDFQFTANTFTAQSGSSIVVPDGGLTFGSTAITSTAAELNILDGVTSTAAELNIVDGNTSATSTTIADADRVVLNDNGTMVQAAVTDLKTYIGGGTLVKVGDVRSNSAAGNHDLTGIFSDTYDKYFFSLSTFPITAGQYLYMQFLNSSNNPITTGYYGAAYGLNQSGGEVRHSDNGTSAIKLNDVTSNSRAWQAHGYIKGPTSGITNNKTVTWQSRGSNDVDVTYTQTGGYLEVSSTDATGMRIYSGVNLAAISLQVYGIVDTKHYNGS